MKFEDIIRLDLSSCAKEERICYMCKNILICKQLVRAMNKRNNNR